MKSELFAQSDSVSQCWNQMENKTIVINKSQLQSLHTRKLTGTFYSAMKTVNLNCKCAMVEILG